MPSRRVLVMDDDSVILEIASTLLEYLDYEAVTCTRGEDAVELYRLSLEQGTPFSVAILDLKVEHGLGGIDAAKAILALDPGAKLIVSSAYNHHPPICKRLFIKSLPKPYTLDDMGSVLSAL